MPDETPNRPPSTDLFQESGADATLPPAVPTPTLTTEVPPSSTTFRTGQRFGDFIIIRRLGKGGFATVYLALDVQLDRHVALKISNDRGLGEGKLLAELEHEHIVQVYAQFTESRTQKHCLCLQYVPGATLADVIERLHAAGTAPSMGSQILDAIRSQAGDPVALDPAGLRNREILSHIPFAAAVCRVGQQLAEALEFAHLRGVLHCDIKPANVLINPYGRPLLADFNIAVASEPGQPARAQGGTLAYMAPEQLALLMKEPNQTVDARSDIYSLGVLLFELFTGRIPFELAKTESFHDRLGRLRRFKAAIDWEKERLPALLERVLRRCLDPDPARRYPDAGSLAKALKHAFELLTTASRLPAGNTLTRLALQAPVQVLLVLLLLPHVVSTVVNIAYNSIEIQLNEEQTIAFFRVIAGYNLFIYPVTLSIMLRQILPIMRQWRRIDQSGALTGEEVDEIRRRSLTLSGWGVFLALAGWLPGGVLFPLLIDLQAGPVGALVYGQFMLSFTLGGLIALTYSHFGIQFIVLRVIYPRLGNPDTYSREKARQELERARRWFSLFEVLAAAVPLFGAALLIAVAGEMTISFRLLATSLIVLGMVGVGLAVNLTERLNSIAGLLEGADLPAGRQSGLG